MHLFRLIFFPVSKNINFALCQAQGYVLGIHLQVETACLRGWHYHYSNYNTEQREIAPWQVRCRRYKNAFSETWSWRPGGGVLRKGCLRRDLKAGRVEGSRVWRWLVQTLAGGSLGRGAGGRLWDGVGGQGRPGGTAGGAKEAGRTSPTVMMGSDRILSLAVCALTAESDSQLLVFPHGYILTKSFWM